MTVEANPQVHCEKLCGYRMSPAINWWCFAHCSGLSLLIVKWQNMLFTNHVSQSRNSNVIFKAICLKKKNIYLKTLCILLVYISYFTAFKVSDERHSPPHCCPCADFECICGILRRCLDNSWFVLFSTLIYNKFLFKK